METETPFSHRCQPCLLSFLFRIFSCISRAQLNQLSFLCDFFISKKFRPLDLIFFHNHVKVPCIFLNNNFVFIESSNSAEWLWPPFSPCCRGLWRNDWNNILKVGKMTNRQAYPGSSLIIYAVFVFLPSCKFSRFKANIYDTMVFSKFYSQNSLKSVKWQNLLETWYSYPSNIIT